METATLQNREFDVLCVGLAVGNIVVRPVSPAIFDVDTTQVDHIAITGGGDAFNQACVLSALGNQVSLLSRMAEDGSGRIMLDALAKRGVDVSRVALDRELGTSTCVVLVKEDGQRCFCTYKGCLRKFGKEDVDPSVVKKARLVSIGGLFALPSFDRHTSVELFRAAREAGTITVCDTKYDAFHIGLQGIGELLSYTDYFFPSYDEAAYLSGLRDPKEIARFFHNRGAGYVGIKLGGEGCYIRSDQFEGMIPSFSAPIVDTTGAGDNFMAGFIHGVLEGWEMRDCATFANAVGALAVTRLGATSDMPYWEPVRAILAQTQQGRNMIEGVLNHG